MKKELKQITCPTCGFVMKGNGKEVVEKAHKHAHDKHGMHVDESDLRKMMKDA